MKKKGFFFEQVSTPTSIQVDVDQAYERVLDRRKKQKNTSRLWIMPIFRYAASILLLCLFGAIVYLSFFYNRAKIYEVANGKKMEIKLEDGTQVWLNGGSKLTVSGSFGEKERKVQLLGEGFFRVKKDPEHPFIVQTSAMHIRVLGTVFNIRAYPEEKNIETILVEGKVEMAVPGGHQQQKYIMAPGDKISVSSEHKVLAETVNPHPQQLKSDNVVQQQAEPKEISEILWHKNVLAFNGDAMALVKSKIEKWYGVKIQINNPALYEKHFTGQFREAKVEAVLNLLKEAGGIEKIEIKNNVIQLE